MTRDLLQTLAETYGTPLYVFDGDAFADRAAQIAEAFGPQVRLCYSIKANSFLLGCLPSQVTRLEVCSPGELEICRAMAVDPARIVFSGLNKTSESVAAALDCQAGVLTAESPKHLALIHQAAQARGVVAPVLLRLTGGDQFGMDEDDLRAILRRREDYPCVEFTGLHFFTGTQKAKAKKILQELDYVNQFADSLASDLGFRGRELEYGTGLFADYFGENADQTEAELLDRIAPAIRAAGERFSLTVEMGRFLASTCGTYLTRVNDVKTNCGVRYVILDGGSHQLRYDGQVMGMRQPPVFVVSGGGAPEECTLCGSLCATSDRLAQNITLPALEPGNLVGFSRVGAYSVMEGTALFLSRELPRVVLFDKASGPRLVRDFVATAPLNHPGSPA